MTGVILGALLLVLIWPLRVRITELRRHPSLAVLPGLFTASLVYYLNPTYGLAAFGVFISLMAATSLLERRSARQCSPATEHAFEAVADRAARRSLVLAISIVLWLSLRDVMASGPSNEAILGAVAGCLVFASVAQARRSGALNARIVVWFGTLFLSVALIIGGLLGREWIPCRAQFGKCTAAGQLYSGVFNSENALAVLATLLAMFALQLTSFRRRWHLILVLLLVLYLTGSRTSQVALLATAAGIAVISMTAVRLRSTSGFRANRLLAFVGMSATTAAALWLITVATSDQFSMRGNVWRQARSFLGSFPVVGLGRGRYVELLQDGYFSGHYPHSQYLLLLFFGGLVGVVLYVGLITSMWMDLRGETRRAIALAAAPLIFTIVHGINELSWNPVGVDPNLWTIAALFAVGAMNQGRASDQSIDPSSAATDVTGRT